MIQDIRICNIYAPDKEDYDLLVGMLSKHPVRIFNEIPENPDTSISSIIIGCMAVKEKYPEHNLFDKDICSNLTWTYSSKEKGKDFQKNINDFVVGTLKKWLSIDFILFDPFLHGDFNDFINKNLNRKLVSFLYFHSGALYINNDNKNYIINLKNLSLIEPKLKEKLTSFLKSGQFLLYSYNNIAPYVNPNEVLRVDTLENICWIKFCTEIEEDTFFNIIPGFDIRKYIPFLMSGLPNFDLNEEEKRCLIRLEEKDTIVKWISNRTICFSPDFTHETLKVQEYEGKKFASLNYSHKRTITGRIMCKDSYNVQNLQRDGDDKKMLISRFNGGKILVCDYVSFESKIALYMCGDEDFISRYWDKDLHLESAKIIFGNKKISDDERKLSKEINHAIMFGAGEELLLRKLAQNKSPEEALYKVRLFLRPILKKTQILNDYQKNHGYIINDWGYIINPKKEFAAFSNYIQSTAAEILIDKLFEVKNYLKNKETQFLFPVHDSMIFDVSPRELILLDELPKILSTHKGKTFGISYKVGNNYKDLNEEKFLI